MMKTMVEKTVARVSQGVVKTSLRGDQDLSGGGEGFSGGGGNFSREGVYANHSSSASRSSSAISQSSSVSSPKSSRGSAAPLNAVIRCRIHCISNSLKSGRGSLFGVTCFKVNFISRVDPFV